MADSPHAVPSDLVKFAIGLAGAVVSLKFVKDASPLEKVLMTLGGALLSFLAASPASAYLHVANAEGLIGFLLGLFGMAVVSKVYEMIQYVDARRIVDMLMEKVGLRAKGD